MKVFALIMAGGSGSRMGSEKAKQSLELAGKKIFRITVEKFNGFKCIDGIVFIGRKEDLEEYRTDLADLNKVAAIVEGGETRAESVCNGLTELEKYSPEIVAIHDAVRPFVDETAVEQSVKAAFQYGGAVVAVPCVDTVSEVNEGFVKEVLRRDRLRNLQTPQTFRFDLLKKAYRGINDEKNTFLTDDTGAFIEIGGKIKVIDGSAGNIKITTPLDFIIAEKIFKV